MLQGKAGSNLGQLKLETVPHLMRQMWALKSRLSARQSSRASFSPIQLLICWLDACAGSCCGMRRTVCAVLWPPFDRGQKITSEEVRTLLTRVSNAVVCFGKTVFPDQRRCDQFGLEITGIQGPYIWMLYLMRPAGITSVLTSSVYWFQDFGLCFFGAGSRMWTRYNHLVQLKESCSQTKWSPIGRPSPLPCTIDGQ